MSFPHVPLGGVLVLPTTALRLALVPLSASDAIPTPEHRTMTVKTLVRLRHPAIDSESDETVLRRARRHAAQYVLGEWEGARALVHPIDDHEPAGALAIVDIMHEVSLERLL